MVKKQRTRKLSLTKLKRPLKATISYNVKVARRAHEVSYYRAMGKDVQENEWKLNQKKKFACSHKRIITDMIHYYKQHAKDYLDKTWIILDKIYQRNVKAARYGESKPIHSDLLGIVASVPMLIVAYRAIRSNKGAMAEAYVLSKDRRHILTPFQRSYLKKTFSMPDGISMDVLRTTSKLLKQGKYPWGSSRRIWIDKPGSTAKRPITIPPFVDRMVQSAIRMVLEAIYEPWFDKTNRSFGFRPRRGCHDAIYLISTPMCKNMRTAVEGDFKSAYDRVDKDILTKILSYRIRDRKFLSLLTSRLDYQHFDTETKTYVTDTTGVQQGGSDSPYLFNIYLAEFDDFMVDYCNKLARKLNVKVSPDKNFKERTQLESEVMKYRRRIAGGRKKDLNLYSKEERYGFVKQVRRLRFRMRKLPSANLNHQIIKFMYIRYADDWILLTNGSKLLGEKIKRDATKWASDNLRMTLSEEKTNITDITRDKAHFLGFEVGATRTRKLMWVDHAIGKQGDKKLMLVKVAGQDTCVYPDRKRLINRMYMKQYCDKNGFPREVPWLVDLESFTIIERFNSVIRGLCNYYVGFAENNSYLSQWLYILRYSCLKTLASKYRLSIGGLHRRFGYNDRRYGKTIKFDVNIKAGDDGIYTKSWTLLTARQAIDLAREAGRIRTIADRFWNTERGNPDSAQLPRGPRRFPNVKDDDYLDSINWVNIRTQACLEFPCAVCGKLGSSEMHHIKAVRKNSFASISEDTPWKQVMSLRNRKQVPVCQNCHMNLIHAGKYDGPALVSRVPKKLYDNRAVDVESYIKPGIVFKPLTMKQKG